jgi:hypothetical protein
LSIDKLNDIKINREGGGVAAKKIYEDIFKTS